MKTIAAAAALGLAVFSSFACGGYGASPSAPGTSSNPPPGNAVVINVIGVNGAQSFSPNPATIPAAELVVWHNIDTTTHRVVLDDGALDTGNIGPGQYSAPMTLTRFGPYHCSIHPPMIGSLSAEATP